MAVVLDQGKTAFAGEVLTKSPQANVKAVNDAWREAGRDGSISYALVSEIRSDMNLTGNIRPGPRPALTERTASKANPSKVVKTAVTRAAKANAGPKSRLHRPGLTSCNSLRPASTS